MELSVERSKLTNNQTGCLWDPTKKDITQSLISHYCTDRKKSPQIRVTLEVVRIHKKVIRKKILLNLSVTCLLTKEKLPKNLIIFIQYRKNTNESTNKKTLSPLRNGNLRLNTFKAVNHRLNKDQREINS